MNLRSDKAMCGISDFFNHTPTAERHLEIMNLLQKHRGPDKLMPFPLFLRAGGTAVIPDPSFHKSNYLGTTAVNNHHQR